MIRLLVAAVGLSIFAFGCGDDGASPSATGSTSDDPASSGGSTTTTQPTSGTNPSSSGQPDESTSSTSSDATTTGSSSGTTGDEFYYCNGWDEDASRPFLELYSDSQQTTAMTSGGVWPISCGGQGSWMFAIFPTLGGFSPEGGTVEFLVDIEVEGFSGPSGQFFLSPGYPYDVQCSSGGGTFDGGFLHDCIAVLPPDEYLADLSVLDGASATVTVELLGPEGTALASVELTDVTLSAPAREVSEECFF